MLPESGASSPDAIFNKVDLPEPVKPTMETNSPSSTDRFTFLRTSLDVFPERNDFETFWISMNANLPPPATLWKRGLKPATTLWIQKPPSF